MFVSFASISCIILSVSVDFPAPGIPASIVIEPCGKPSPRFSSIGVLNFFISLSSIWSSVNIFAVW